MNEALVIGGTRFIGRFLVEELLEAGYNITLFTRGNRPVPSDNVSHYTGDRTNRTELEKAYEAVDPDLVVDMAAYYPRDVSDALDVFSSIERYVFVSSMAAYAHRGLPAREGETPLRPCSEEQAKDESRETYGNRKAECDRLVFSAAEEGVSTVSIRPTAIYGPHDYTERFDYWIDRVNQFDRVLIPGDRRTMPLHLGYVSDVASAIRIVAERGTSGEAYNVAHRDQIAFDDLIEIIADILGTDISVTHAIERDLSTLDLEVDDFPLCLSVPYYISTEKLSSLGWDSTSYVDGVEKTIQSHLQRSELGTMHGPERGREMELIPKLSEE